MTVSSWKKAVENGQLAVEQSQLTVGSTFYGRTL